MPHTMRCAFSILILLIPCATSLCPDGYGSIADGGCAPCNDPFCAICTDNATACSKCVVTYGFDANVVRCSRCWDEHCHDCASASTTCNQCFSGYGLDSAGACTPCPPGCLACRDGRCMACPAGQGIDGNACTPCHDPNCFDCAANPAACAACRGTMVLRDRRCTQASQCSISQCAECDGALCMRCKEGWALTSQGGCVQATNSCGVGCAECTDGTCARCAPFWAITQNANCQPCELQWACSGVCGACTRPQRTNSDESQDAGTTVWQAPTCFQGPLSVPVQLVVENGTLCGACSALAPVPLPIGDVFYQALSHVAATLGVVADSLTPVGMCGDVQRHGAWENSTYDVRAKGDGVLMRGLYRVERTAEGSKTTVLQAWRL